MESSNDRCEACKVAAVNVIERADDKDQPYRVCNKCHQRLVTYSLPPIEWYNLAVIHSPHKFLLHDDFYDDNGLSYQLEEDLILTAGYEAPTLKDVESNLGALIDFSVTRWSLEDEVITALNKHNASLLFSCVKEKFYNTHNLEVKSRMLEILADVLGPIDVDWLRDLWRNYNDELLYPLSLVTATTLPDKEGLDNVFARLNSKNKKELPKDAFSCLYRFRSNIVLDWIEDTCEEFDDNWGRLAAVSYPTWERMKTWLGKGRPLSLIALDTMENCCVDFSDPIIKRISPKVIGLGTDNYEKVLNEYYQSDNVPRVKRKVAGIIENKEIIFE